jgi:hypothetical protein
MLAKQTGKHLRDPILWFTQVMLVNAKEVQILHVPGWETPQLTDVDIRHVDCVYSLVRIV